MNQKKIYMVIKLIDFLKLKHRPINSMSRYLEISERLSAIFSCGLKRTKLSN